MPDLPVASTRVPIRDYLKRRLEQAGTARFDAIADAATLHAGLALDSPDRVHASFLRKFFYGERKDPRIQTIEPLLDYFLAIDRGEIKPVQGEKSAVEESGRPSAGLGRAHADGGRDKPDARREDKAS